MIYLTVKTLIYCIDILLTGFLIGAIQILRDTTERMNEKVQRLKFKVERLLSCRNIEGQYQMYTTHATQLLTVIRLFNYSCESRVRYFAKAQQFSVFYSFVKTNGN